MGKTLFAIIGFVLAGGIFFFYTKPTYSGVQDMQSQIARYDDALTKATQLQQVRQKLLDKYNAFSPGDINKISTMIPDHVDNIGLILELDDLASHYGMALQNVDISAGSGAAAAASTAPGSGGIVNVAQTAAVVGSTQKYDSLILHFSTFGTYDNFQSFMHDLESSLRIVDLVSLTIAPDQSGTSKGPPAYHYDVGIRTYWLK